MNSTQIQMRKIANKFYNKFKNTSIPVKKILPIFEKYQSVVIVFPEGSSFAVPYFFYQQLKLEYPPDYNEIFNEEHSWIDLLSKIYERTFSIKSK